MLVSSRLVPVHGNKPCSGQGRQCMRWDGRGLTGALLLPMCDFSGFEVAIVSATARSLIVGRRIICTLTTACTAHLDVSMCSYWWMHKQIGITAAETSSLKVHMRRLKG
jgi:hypothetical protein